MRFAHTNIVASDWKRLAEFYSTVFGCAPVPPSRDMAGKWLDGGTGLINARLRGVHLRLPGHGANGPTLEIFQYDDSGKSGQRAANDCGFTHIAFEVDDVGACAQLVLANGGQKLGEVVETKVEEAGQLTFVYMRDPEGNILELQHWG